MLKFSRLIVVKSAILILFLPEAVLASPRPVTAVFPSVPDSESDPLLCYLQTTEGQTLNLDRLCLKPTPTVNADLSSGKRDLNLNSPPKSRVSNRPPCYLIDANGRPC